MASYSGRVRLAVAVGAGMGVVGWVGRGMGKGGSPCFAILTPETPQEPERTLQESKATQVSELGVVGLLDGVRERVGVGAELLGELHQVLAGNVERVELRDH